MARITQRYTHKYDATHDTMRIIWAFIGSFVVVALLEKIRYKLSLPRGLTAIINLTFFIWIPVVSEISKKTFWPSWLPTWRYVRNTLGVKIDKNEALKLTFLFDGSLGGQWFPLIGVKSIEEPYRKEALFRFANHIASGYGWSDPFPEYEDRSKNDKNSRNNDEKNNENLSQHSDRNQAAKQEALRAVGVNKNNATWEEIKHSYRRKIMQYHPDRYVNEDPELIKYAEEMAKKINEAYAYLRSLEL